MDLRILVSSDVAFARGRQTQRKRDGGLWRRATFGHHSFGEFARGFDVRWIVSSTKACKRRVRHGRRTQHVSRSGASKVTSVGGGAVALPKVYIVRGRDRGRGF